MASASPRVLRTHFPADVATPHVCFALPCVLCPARLPQGFFAKLFAAPGDEGECTSNGLYCFTGLPAKDAFEVFDVNADDPWSALYGADTRYGGGKGVAGKLWWLLSSHPLGKHSCCCTTRGSPGGGGKRALRAWKARSSH
jgi:hypothetical protein